MSNEAVHEGTPISPARARIVFTMAVAANRIAVPASIVTVRTYDGETEDEALQRHGVDRDRPGAEPVFIHLT